MNDSPIGVFDSGSGGLTVLDACRKLLPNENFVYVSDSRKGGWGSLPANQIALRACACADKLSEYGCKAVVAACNTATESSICALRHDYELPFVGLEPALLPAVRAFPSGKVTVICTPATSRQPKFKELLDKCKTARVAVRPQPKLASMIENNLHSLDSLKREAERIVEEEKPDALVLGCTHYVFIRYIFESLLGAERVFDGNSGAARRLLFLLTERELLSGREKLGSLVFDTI